MFDLSDPEEIILLFLALGTLVWFSAMGSSMHEDDNQTHPLAQRPPMGWNSWNAFGCDVDAALIREMADAMVASGMADAGYEYINIDDCWMDSTRTPDGRLRPNPETFPNGIDTVADYVHERGLKLGIYSSAGTETCQGLPGSINHETADAQTFARWGVDYLKYDNCGDHLGQSPPERYRAMSEALDATGRPIVFSVCEWGRNEPWTWAPELGGNLWRTTSDIGPCFKRPCGEDYTDWKKTVLEILDAQVGLAQYAGPGHWNDPDMLEVGNPGLTPTESRAHFSLWALLAAPLLAGNDLRRMDDTTRRILTNEEVIAVNQDRAGIQGRKVRDDGAYELWARPLHDGDRAVLLLNRSDASTTLHATVAEVGMTGADRYVARDLWAHTDSVTAGRIRTRVPSHGVAMYRVEPHPATSGPVRRTWPPSP